MKQKENAHSRHAVSAFLVQMRGVNAIFHILRITQITADQVQNLVLIAAEQEIESQFVAFLHPSDKFFVSILCHTIPKNYRAARVD